MLTDAFHSALEYARHVLRSAGEREHAHPWPAAADGSVVNRKLLAEFGVDAALVGMQGSLAPSIPANDTADLVFGCAVSVEGAGVSPALD